jgi:ABC-type antimicrobial peptide transport system permease subunit
LPFLIGVTTGDPISYGISGIVLITAGIIAIMIPVRYAMSVDPMTAIRYE